MTGVQNADADGTLKEIYAGMMTGVLTEGINAVSLDEGTRGAIEKLLENMAPSIEQMETLREEYRAAGKELPAEIASALNDVATLELITGDADAMWSYVGQQIEGSEEYSAATDRIFEVGGTLPKAISDGMIEKKEQVDRGIDEVYRHLVDRWTGKFSEPIKLNAKLNINYAANQPYSFAYPHAEGGIFNTPHIGMLAEAGAEAYVPLDRSRRSVSIWQQAGEALGVLSGNSSQNEDNRSIVYSPTYQIYGADEATVRSATQGDQERFEMMMDQYLRNQRRLAF